MAYDDNTVHESISGPENKEIRNIIRRPFVFVISLIILCAVLSAFLWIWFLPSKNIDVIRWKEIHSVSGSIRAGDYSSSFEEYNALITSPIATASQRARATRNIVEGLYEATGGDISALLKSVQDLKVAIVLEVAPKHQAELITVLANVYEEYGLNPLIFNEVYSGEPYESFRVGTNKNESKRNLLLWAYGIYENAWTAQEIAKSYAKDIVDAQYLSEKARAVFDIETAKTKAEYYQREADRLREKEELENANYTKSSRYMSMIYGRTYTNSVLAFAYNDDTSYRGDFEKLISTVAARESVEDHQYHPYSYWLYASFLILIDNDEAAARAAIESAVSLAQNDSRPETNEFRVFVGGLNLDSKRVFSIQSTKRLMLLSPEFKAFVEDAQAAQE